MDRNAAPFLSLCMIVKDEERFIEQCLESATDLVDEVVIYDTGSTDRTIELAEALGATVIRGFWDDDFGRARNEALARCRGTWILWLDADEVIEADRGVLHQALKRSSKVDAVRIPIQNVGALGGDFEHAAIRIFRRSGMAWVGQLHEHVERRDGRPLRRGRLEQARILHHGYTSEMADDREKADRNLRIALAALDRADTDEERGTRLINVARSYSMAGDKGRAVDHFVQARAVTDGDDHAFATRLGAEILIDAGRYDEAREWIEDYSCEGGDDGLAAFLRGSVALFADGDGSTLADIDPETPVSDRFGLTIAQHVVRKRVGQALLVSERWDDAAVVLGSLIEADPSSPLWPGAVLATHRAGRDLAPLAGLIPADRLRNLIAQFIVIDADARGAFLHALVDRFGPMDPNLVAFAAGHAARLDTVEEMLPWATMIRTSPFELPCPVIERAKDPASAPTERFLAAASAHAAFRDPEALTLLFEVSDLLSPQDEGDAAFILTEIAPDLIVS